MLNTWYCVDIGEGDIEIEYLVASIGYWYGAALVGFVAFVKEKLANVCCCSLCVQILFDACSTRPHSLLPSLLTIHFEV